MTIINDCFQEYDVMYKYNNCIENKIPKTIDSLDYTWVKISVAQTCNILIIVEHITDISILIFF